MLGQWQNFLGNEDNKRETKEGGILNSKHFLMSVKLATVSGEDYLFYQKNVTYFNIVSIKYCAKFTVLNIAGISHKTEMLFTNIDFTSPIYFTTTVNSA